MLPIGKQEDRAKIHSLHTVTWKLLKNYQKSGRKLVVEMLVFSSHRWALHFLVCELLAESFHQMGTKLVINAWPD